MDGTFAPLLEITQMIEDMSPLGNAYLVVDEAHSMAIYGPDGRRRVALLGLEEKVLARLVTFGKALAASGAVILTNDLIWDSPSTTPVQSSTPPPSACRASSRRMHRLRCSQMGRLHGSRPKPWICHPISPLRSSIASPLSAHTCNIAASRKTHVGPLPIIPLLTSCPRPRSTFLLSKHGLNARPMTWPTVPKARVEWGYVCMRGMRGKRWIDLSVLLLNGHSRRFARKPKRFRGWAGSALELEEGQGRER
ncbi:hypothetical protein BKA70DRAFT_193480 [Coprinopsis sp. MPI-PUGE-AT-0042]|nr:hypothetical protein BKA70DRAFT_193480 [Coprinopsis sp. MPI-PUGE-AT-0042]